MMMMATTEAKPLLAVVIMFPCIYFVYSFIYPFFLCPDAT